MEIGILLAQVFSRFAVLKCVATYFCFVGIPGTHSFIG